ncbi:MAG: DUF4149 domain-containing protein [Deltaproteobacteria bacterium]|nr:DUF4149 domain-containing protein [Deltaproteobacteria bacterium]
MGVAKAVFWLALVVWLGEIVFFSFIVAPSVFGALPQEIAGQVVGVIFPRYYGVGTVAGAIALVAALMLRSGTSATRPWSAVVLMLALMVAATLYAGRVIQPRTQALRPQIHEATVDPAVRAEFDRLHRLAVQLNGAVLLLGIATVCVAATSLRLPRS